MTSQPRSFLDDDARPSAGPGKVICPKCGMEQPLTLDCVNCGAIIDPPKSLSKPAAAPPAPQTGGYSVAAEPAPQDSGPGEADGDLYSGDIFQGDVYQGDVYQGDDAFAGAPAKGAGRSSQLYSGHQRRAFEPPTLTAISIFGETFSILSRHFLGFMIIAGVVLLPAILFALFSSSEFADLEMEGATPADAFSALKWAGVSGLLMMLCAPIAAAAVTYGVARELRRKSASMIGCVQAGLSVLFPALAVTILQTLIITGVSMLISVPSFFALTFLAAFFAQGSPVGSAVLMIAGVIGIVLLVLKFAARYAVTVPVTVEERPGIFRALSRSEELTQGLRWVIVRFYLLLGLVGGVIFVIQFLIGMGASAGTAEVIAQLGSILTTAINATGAAVIYYRLRSIDERVNVDELASVFD